MQRQKWLGILPALFIVLACTSLSPKEQGVSSRIPAKAEAGEAELNYDLFLAAIDDPAIQTIEQALKKLKDLFPTYLSFHTLGYKSRSIQKSSYLYPRVIVFGPDAKFVFSFNGDPSLDGYNAFETLSYDEANTKYTFREITFKHEPGELNLPAEDIQSETKNLLISRPTPSLCMGCHQERARPIWQGYHLWAGFYGSTNDGVFFGADLAYPRILFYPGKEVSHEAKYWNEFNRPENRQAGRYRYLPAMNSRLSSRIADIAFPPVAERKNYDESKPEPNFLLTVLFHQQAKAAIANRIVSGNQGRALSLALFAITTCSNIEMQGGPPIKEILQRVIPERLSKKLNPFPKSDSVYLSYLKMHLQHAEDNVFTDMVFMDELEDGKLTATIDVNRVDRKDPEAVPHVARMEKISPKFVEPALSFQDNVGETSPVIDLFLRAATGERLSEYTTSFQPSGSLHDGHSDENGLVFYLQRAIESKFPSEEWTSWVSNAHMIFGTRLSSGPNCEKMIKLARSTLQSAKDL